ncbi:MAG: hypothetical protein LYZ66_00295 [Nitrososphaerales archaeon]|nr:hypothetical protein [Nitrososphaerales archaeon]
MDPLVVLDQAESQGKIPRAIGKKVRGRMKYLLAAVDRVERASGLRYPAYYVEPVLPVSNAGAEFGRAGILFARVIPTTATGKLSILVQFTAALVAFSPKGTLEAVAAHEFTHYVDLVRRLNRTSVVSDERVTTLFEATYADSERVVPPSLIFSERSLVGLVRRKFKDGLSDPTLNRKVEEGWLAKGLPVRRATVEENVIRLGMGTVMSASFDGALLEKISRIEEKMKS